MAVKIAEPARERARGSAVRRRRRARRLAPLLAVVLAAAGLFWCYLRLSETYPSGSDAASNALEAWSMLHGNWLLHGWTLSDVSFYTTELPEYAAVELVRGLGPDVLPVSAALTYTLLVVLSALLARGRARGAEGWARALIAAGIMVAPQLGNGVHVLLTEPDHVGTQVLILGAFLLLDRAPRRWHAVAGCGALLTVAVVADKIAIVDAVVPLAFAALVHAAWTRRPLARFELSLAAAAGAGCGTALLALRVIHQAGGFTLLPVQTGLITLSSAPAHLALAWHGVLSLFGADVTAAAPGTPTLLACLHAPGIALAVAAFAVVAWHVPRQGDLVSDVLAIAIVVNMAGYVASVIPATAFDTREMAALLPFGAVLAGRVFGPWLTGPGPRPARPRPPQKRPARNRGLDGAARPGAVARGVRPGAVALAVAGACQLAALGFATASPAATEPEQGLASWLTAHHLASGLGTFTEDNITTVDSGGKVRLLTVSWLPPARPTAPLQNVTAARGVIPPPPTAGRVAVPRLYQSSASWYDPRTQYANFIVTGTADGTADLIPHKQIIALAGPPAWTYQYRSFTIMVWNENLLPLLGRPPSTLGGVIGRP